MPKHSKNDSSDSDSDSGPDDNGPPQKKTKAGSASVAKTNDAGETYFDIEGLKRVTVREFKGRLFVDFREFYEKDGKILPGKKGISLSASQWNKIKNLADDIDSVVARFH